MATKKGQGVKLDPHEKISRRAPARENILYAPFVRAAGLITSLNFYKSMHKDRTLKSAAFEVGQEVAKRLKAYFSREQLAAFEALRKSRGMSYLIVKRMPFEAGFTFPHSPKSLADPAIDRQFWRTDFIVAGVFNLLGAECKSRYPTNPSAAVARTVLTAPADAQVGDRDGLDIALRFHQSTVEKGLEIEGADATCSYKAYFCLRNRRRIPVFLMRVRDVIEAIDPADKTFVIGQLKRDIYEKHGPKYDLVDAGQITQNQPILGTVANDDGVADYVMSFDPERVRTPDPEGTRAIRLLRLAMMRARETARRIVLEEGDLLIVDNLRVFISRREYDPQSLFELLLAFMFRRNTRMLRQYYGFPVGH